jgi:hypothetical protein
LGVRHFDLREREWAILNMAVGYGRHSHITVVAGAVDDVVGEVSQDSSDTDTA